MNNVWRLFRFDLGRLKANVMSIIITLGLVLVPSLFAWYNIIACWNVFDNTGNLTVAVANTDEGYQSDLIPLRINIGDQVVSALRANDQIDWHITDEEDAIDGAKSGRYYAAVVIPKSFSRDMLTFYTGDAGHADIVYYANEKKSAIAPKITDQGADTVSYQVNAVFAQTLSEVSLAQSTVMALGNLFFLDVQVTSPWLFMVCFWGAGLVFTFIIYALVVSFANLGKAIAVLLLIVQVTGCGGSFPLQIMPDFVQALSPWLPATHVVNAMRSAMMGTYGGDFWAQMGALALFLIPAALLGLVLRKPLEKFMEWYVEKVESSKLIS